MLEVLGRATSINVRKVLWTCDEIGLAVDHAEWGLGGLHLDAPEFVALNPNGLVPVVRDGGFVLWESNAICRWLAAEHGRDDLLPREPRPRALVERWMDWQATELNNAWRHAFMGLVRRHPDFADPAAVARSTQAWNRHMTLLDGELARTGGAFVCGERFTLADVVLGLSTHRWRSTPFDKPALRAVERWHARLCERPAFLTHGRDGPP